MPEFTVMFLCQDMSVKFHCKSGISTSSSVVSSNRVYHTRQPVRLCKPTSW